MSDQHASRAFRKNAPKGTRHDSPSKWKVVQNSDPRFLEILKAEGKLSRQGKNRLKRLKKISAPEILQIPEPSPEPRDEQPLSRLLPPG